MKNNIMKSILFITLFFLSIIAYAQETHLGEVKTLYISKDVTLHFRSPEAINYIDISTNKLIGDIPLDNVAKVKCLVNDTSYFHNQEIGIVSIIGESFLAQYKIVYSAGNSNNVITDIEIQQEEMKPTQYPSVTLTRYEMQKICLQVQQRSRKFRKTQSKAMGLKAILNNIYSFGDYIFVDLTFENESKIKYDIDLISFKIEDKKIYKATNNQSIEIHPVYKLYHTPYFRHTYRNVFVFEKFTFPNDKMLRIRLIEKEISGRTLDLLIEYRDLLHSDTF